MSDAKAIFDAYAADPAVTRYLAWKPNASIRETRAFLANAVKTWRAGTEHLWAMTLADGTLVGSAGMRIEGPRIEIGYVLARTHWSRGLATEAARALVTWARRQKSVYRVWATCDVDNKASAHVLEKLGMTREGILRRWIVRPHFGNVPRDCCCYSIVKPGGSKP